MKNSTLKFLLLISLILNISFLGTAAFQYYRHDRQSTYWTSPFEYKIKEGHFLFDCIEESYLECICLSELKSCSQFFFTAEF